MENRFEIKKPLESYSIDEIEGFLKTFTPLELGIIRVLYDFKGSMHVKGILDVYLRDLYDAVIELSEINPKTGGELKQADFQKAVSKIRYCSDAVDFNHSKIENFIKVFSEDYRKMANIRDGEDTKVFRLKISKGEKPQIPDFMFNELIRKHLSESGIAKIPSFNTIENTLEGLEKGVVIVRKLKSKKANAVYALNLHFYVLLKKIWS